MQILEKYEVYGDEVLKTYDPRPNMREIIKVRIQSFSQLLVEARDDI